MKILLVNDHASAHGGAETYFFNLAKLLKDNGHEVFGLSFSPSPAPEKAFPNLEIFTEKKNKLARDLRAFYYPTLTKYFGSFLNRHNFDVFHFQNIKKYSLPLLKVRKHFPNTKFIQTIHDSSYICETEWLVKDIGTLCPAGIGIKCLNKKCKLRHHTSSHSWLRYKYNVLAHSYIRRRAKNKMDSYIVPSQELKHKLAEHSFKNLHHLTNFIDLDNSEIAPLPDKPNILFVGRMVKSKGPQILLKAIKTLAENNSDFTATFVGSGPMEKELQDYANKNNLDNKVEFVGKVKHSELNNFYKNCSMVVIPSLVSENQPLVALEAMNYGRAIIGSRLGGLPDIISENENGMLFSSGNALELSQKLANILPAREKLTTWGKISKNIVQKKYSTHEHLKSLLEFYKS
ncbi:MAG: glycosyltransferase family 4 protein [bacterium]